MAENSSPSSAPAADAPPETEPRRDFLYEFLALAIGGIVALFPFLAGLVTFFDPWRKKEYPAGAAAGDGYVKVASLAAVPQDVPRRFPVFANLVDAWTVSPNQPIGAVYLLRQGEEVTCFNAICPHAGCFVGFSAQRGEFSCPCHESFFSLEGKRGGHSPSPRDLDRLPTKIVDESGTQVVMVEFKNFLTGRADQVAKT